MGNHLYAGGTAEGKYLNVQVHVYAMTYLTWYLSSKVSLITLSTSLQQQESTATLERQRERERESRREYKGEIVLVTCFMFKSTSVLYTWP